MSEKFYHHYSREELIKLLDLHYEGWEAENDGRYARLVDVDKRLNPHSVKSENHLEAHKSIQWNVGWHDVDLMLKAELELRSKKEKV